MAWIIANLDYRNYTVIKKHGLRNKKRFLEIIKIMNINSFNKLFK